jgi:fructose-bisphosphate aldolase, class II
MKFSFSLATFLFATQAAAFAPASQSRSTVSVRGTAENLGIPCEDECAIEKYPNLPASIHPGVLTGQAQLDLLKHAKENGKKALRFTPCLSL